jgi:hypothetical protein
MSSTAPPPVHFPAHSPRPRKPPRPASGGAGGGAGPGLSAGDKEADETSCVSSGARPGGFLSVGSGGNRLVADGAALARIVGSGKKGQRVLMKCARAWARV